MRSSTWAMFASLLVVACSSSGPTAQDGQTSPPAPSEAADTPPEPCADGTYRLASGECATFPSLEVQRSPITIAPARDHHTSMVLETSSGPWLYVFGGTDDWVTLHDDIQRARIAADGSLGAFERVGTLPEARAGHCMVRSESRLYLFGGIVGSVREAPSKSSVIIDLDAEGRISATSAGPALPKGVMHLTCDVAGGFVYAFGGRDRRGTSTKLSARARIGESGELSAFEAQTPLDPDRSHHASFVKDGRIYLLGGLSGDPTGEFEDRKDVTFATIGDDGSLGAWTPAGSLPRAISVSSAQLYKDAVYVFGGLEDGRSFSKKIRRATFEEGGVVGPFTTLPAELPDGRGHVHQTPMWKEFIYSVGGKDMSSSLGAVDIGHFE